jgi:hypothetical protein
LRPPKADNPPLRKPSGSTRGLRGRESEVEPRRRVKDPGWLEAGRPAGAIAPERQQGRRGPERIAGGEAQVAQHGCVGVGAQEFCRSRGALQCQARAQCAGGGRIGAQPPPLFAVLGCVLTGAADSKEPTGVWFEIEHVCARPRSRD